MNASMGVEPNSKATLRDPLTIRIDGVLLKVTAVMAGIGITALVAAIAVVIGDIIWRRVGGGSFIGSVDLTQFSVMIAVSWSVPYAFAKGSHVSVDLLSQTFNVKTKRFFDIIANSTGAIICGFLCWLSTKRGLEVWSYGDVSQDLAIPMILFWAFLVTGLAFSAVVCSTKAFRFMLSGAN